MPVKGPNIRRRWIIISSVCVLLLSLVFFIITRPRYRREWVLYQANQAYDKGNYEKAVEKYKELIAFDPNDSSTQYSLGVAYAYNNELSKAHEQAQKLRSLGKEEYQQYANLLEDLIQDAAKKNKK